MRKLKVREDYPCSGDWKFKIKVRAGLVSSEAYLPGSQMVLPWCMPVRGEVGEDRGLGREGEWRQGERREGSGGQRDQSNFF